MIDANLPPPSVFALIIPYAAFGQQPGAQPPAVDPNDPIVRIKDEGMNRSQVMPTLSYLDVMSIGPRLTCVSEHESAPTTGTRETLESVGMQTLTWNPWGPIRRGWAFEKI